MTKFTNLKNVTFVDIASNFKRGSRTEW